MRIRWWNLLSIVFGLIAGAVGAYFFLHPTPPKGPTTSGSDPLDRPLRVGIVTWPGYAGGIVANNGFKANKESIYWRRFKLPVEFMLMEDVDARNKAFAKGGKDGVDIVWSTVDFWANELPGFLKGDVKAKAIMQVDWSRGGDAIVADNRIQKIEDLRGQKISLALYTPSHWLLEYNIRNSGLTADEQSEIVRNIVGKNASPDARDDFLARKVDAAVVWEPDVTDALQKRSNSHVLLSSKTASKLIADVMVVREDFLNKHRDVVKAFVQGWLEGTEEAYRNPDLAAKLLMENEPVYKELGEKSTREQLSTVRWATLADNVEMFDLDNEDRPTGREPLFDRIFKQASQAWVQRGYISQPVSPAVAKETGVLQQLCSSGTCRRVHDTTPPPPPNLCSQAGVETKHVTINFATGKSDLDPQAKQVINDDVSLLPQTLANAYVCLEGNTDSTGNPAVNMTLSRDRAEKVREELVNHFKLQANQLVSIGYGRNNPICREKTAECYAKNRRTDVKVVPMDRIQRQ